MINPTPETEQEFTKDQFRGLTKAFAAAYAEVLQGYVEVLINGATERKSEEVKLNFTTLKAIAVITAENFSSVNITKSDIEK